LRQDYSANLFITADSLFLRRNTPPPLRRLAGGGKLLLAYQDNRISTDLP